MCDWHAFVSSVRNSLRSDVPVIDPPPSLCLWDFSHSCNRMLQQLLWITAISSMQLRATHATNPTIKQTVQLKFQERLNATIIIWLWLIWLSLPTSQDHSRLYNILYHSVIVLPNSSTRWPKSWFGWDNPRSALKNTSYVATSIHVDAHYNVLFLSITY